MEKKELVFEMIKANSNLELYQFFGMMLEEFKMYSDETHQLLIELENEGKLKIEKVRDGETFDSHDRRIITYNYRVKILKNN